MVMEGSNSVMEGRRRRAGAGKRLARLAHKLKHVVTKLAPEVVGPLVREASGEAGRLVRDAACLLGCRGNVEQEPEPEASKLTEREECCWRSLSYKLIPVHQTHLNSGLVSTTKEFQSCRQHTLNCLSRFVKVKCRTLWLCEDMLAHH